MGNVRTSGRAQADFHQESDLLTRKRGRALMLSLCFKCQICHFKGVVAQHGWPCPTRTCRPRVLGRISTENGPFSTNTLLSCRFDTRSKTPVSRVGRFWCRVVQVCFKAHLHEGRHGVVDLRRLPDGALLCLEAKGRQRSVVGATLGNPACEQIWCMRLRKNTIILC